MWNHAWNGYLNNAFPLDELQPLKCVGHDTWGGYSLTLVDGMDTLALMGRTQEFLKWVSWLETAFPDKFDIDRNVSVFETNIRVLGGLLSSHLLAQKLDYTYSGHLLDLAVDLGNRLLRAFEESPSGIPYGTVNLRHGVPTDETTISSVAGSTTYSVEFGVLSALTSDAKYAAAAKHAVKTLWNYRSELDLVGNHIDIVSGKWIHWESR